MKAEVHIILPPITSLIKLDPEEFLIQQKIISLPPLETPKTTEKSDLSIFSTLRLRSRFTEAEDRHLRLLVGSFGTDDWNGIARLMGTKDARQCKDRWYTALHPRESSKPWSVEEDIILTQKYKEYGPRWKKIAKFLNGRTDCGARNRWYLIVKNSEKRIWESMR